MAKSSDYNFLFSGRTFDFGRVLANKIVFSRFFLIPDPPLLSSWFSNGGLETSCDLVTNATRNVMLLTAQSESPEMFQMPSISDLPTSSVLLPILARTLRYAVIWNAPARDALFRRRDFVLHLIYCKCGLVTMQKFFTIKVLTSFSCYIYQKDVFARIVSNHWFVALRAPVFVTAIFVAAPLGICFTTSASFILVFWLFKVSDC